MFSDIFIDIWIIFKYFTVHISGQLTFTVRKKNSDRQSKLVTVSERESKSEIYSEFSLYIRTEP